MATPPWYSYDPDEDGYYHEPREGWYIQPSLELPKTLMPEINLTPIKALWNMGAIDLRIQHPTILWNVVLEEAIKPMQYDNHRLTSIYWEVIEKFEIYPVINMMLSDLLEPFMVGTTRHFLVDIIRSNPWVLAPDYIKAQLRPEVQALVDQARALIVKHWSVFDQPDIKLALYWNDPAEPKLQNLIKSPNGQGWVSSALIRFALRHAGAPSISERSFECYFEPYRLEGVYVEGYAMELDIPDLERKILTPPRWDGDWIYPEEEDDWDGMEDDDD